MVLRLILASVLMHIAFSSIRLTVSLDALAHGAAPFEMGLIVSLLSLGPTFTAVSFGQFIDRRGIRLPVLLGGATLAATCLIGWLFPVQDDLSERFLPLYAASLIAGLGFLFITMVSQKAVGFISTTATRQTNFAWLAMGMSASGLVSPIMTGYIIDSAGHEAVFAAGLAFVATGLAVFAASFRKLPATLGAAAASNKKHTSLDLVKVPCLRSVLIASGLVSMAWDLQHFMLPFYGHAVGLTATQIGWLTGTFFSATFLVRFLMPWTSKHFTEWQFLTLTLAVGGAAYAIFPLFTSFEALLAASFILGLGLGSSQPNVMSLLHTEAPAGRVGEALGIRTMFTNTCHAVLPTTFGVLTAALGAASIFWTMTAILGSAALLSRRHHKNS